jgi:hypothetical protein
MWGGVNKKKNGRLLDGRVCGGCAIDIDHKEVMNGVQGMVPVDLFILFRG